MWCGEREPDREGAAVLIHWSDRKEAIMIWKTAQQMACWLIWEAHAVLTWNPFKCEEILVAQWHTNLRISACFKYELYTILQNQQDQERHR